MASNIDGGLARGEALLRARQRRQHASRKATGFTAPALSPTENDALSVMAF
jgi:hypothetical protein